MNKVEQRKMMRLALRVQALEQQLDRAMVACREQTWELVDLRTRLAEYEDMARAIVERADEQNPVDGVHADHDAGGGGFSVRK